MGEIRQGALLGVNFVKKNFFENVSFISVLSKNNQLKS